MHDHTECGSCSHYYYCSRCVTAVIPLELVGEFVDGALNGALEVEPVCSN